MEIEEKVLLEAMNYDEDMHVNISELNNYACFSIPNISDKNIFKRIIKKLIYKLISWYINPIIRQQEKFNSICAKEMSKK